MPEPIIIEVEEGRTIRGTITDEDGQPVDRVFLSTTGMLRQRIIRMHDHSTSSREDGSYQISRIRDCT